MRKLLLGVIISSVLLFCSCYKYGVVNHTVQYTISSTSNMNVSYTDADGTLKSINNVSSTWSYSFRAPGNGRMVKLIINSINDSAVGGSIFVDGVEASQIDSNTGSVTITAQIP